MPKNLEFLVTLIKKDDYKVHLASLMAAFVCIIAGILIALSIGASLFSWDFINATPGDLFTGAYGFLAFFIPLYLFWAAWLLYNSHFDRGKIFVFSVVLVPFLTLGLGLTLIRDFEIYRQEIAFVDLLGQFGLGFVIISVFVLECVGILVARKVLFIGEKQVQLQVKVQDIVPNSNPPADSAGAIVQQQAPANLEVDPPENIYKLPDWQPLKSPLAFEEINNKDKVLVLDSSVFSPYSQLQEQEEKPSEELHKTSYTKPHINNADYSKTDIDQWPNPYIENNLENNLETPEELPPEEAAIEEIPEELASEEIPEELPDELSMEEFLFQEVSETSADPEVPVPLPVAKKKINNHNSSYFVPVDGILNHYPDGQYWIVDEETHREANILQDTLSEFNIQAEITGIRKGPVITMFEILPAPGVKLSKIVNLQDNIALRLAASSVRIVAPIPGKHAVGIEVPNKKRNIVSFREIIEGELNNKKDGRKTEIPVVLGKGITGEAVTVDLCQMPHLLIAGSTGSGKSVCVNSMILSILYQLPPSDCRLIMIDPKIVELKLYNDIPHLLTPVITEPKRAFQALQYCIYEMERRYACLDSMGVRDIRSYNRRIKERKIATLHMPYIVVIIDEFADLMATTGKELESTLARLAAMSRAVGIHLVLATQRPSIDVITGLIKANIPSRIAFMVASKMDSRIIIDMVGAEKLLGKGDMLYAGPVEPFPIRMQGAYISEEEVERVVEYVKTLGEPEYIDDEIFFEEEEDMGPSIFSDGDDPLYEKALEVVFQQGKASASFIQRRLKIGYNRAARLVEEMEHRGVVGPAQGSRPRELLRAG